MSDTRQSGDSYSAQSFYDDVAAVLEQTLAGQPQRQDVRLKLLEVYATAGHREAFTSHATSYRANLDEGMPGDWFKVRELGESLLLADQEDDLSDPDPGGARSKRFGGTGSDTPLGRALAGLEADYERTRADAGFLDRFDDRLARLTGRPLPPPFEATRLSAGNRGARLFLMRGASRDLVEQKLVNALLQGLLATSRGCGELVAVTRSGVHGVAVASVAAFLGLGCRLHIREGDGQTSPTRLQQAQRLGAAVIRHRAAAMTRGAVDSRSAAAAALNELREHATADWLEAPAARQFVNGLAAGPSPFPTLLRDAHAGIGRALRRALVRETKQLPDTITAPIDHGLDAFNLFVPFLGYRATRLVGVAQPTTVVADEPDHPRNRRRAHYSVDQLAAAERILHAPGHTSTQREHAWLRATERVAYQTVAEDKATRAAEALARQEGLLVSNRAARALAAGLAAARDRDGDRAVAVLIDNDFGGATTTHL